MVALAALMLHLSEKPVDTKGLESHLPLYKIEKGCLFSKKGDLTMVFQLELPEIFTLSSEEYEAVHQTWVRAIKVLPKHTIVHKQDWYLEDNYQAPADEQPTFLNKASARHFKGRPFLRHTCYVMITKMATGRKPASSVFSNLLRPSIIPPSVTNPEVFEEFQDKVGQFERLLSDGGFITIRRLQESEIIGSSTLAGILERYCFLLPEGSRPTIKDISFKPEFMIGVDRCQLFALSDGEALPALCGPRMRYDKYSTDKTKFSTSFATPVGLLLKCNHVYNQFIIIEDGPQTLKKMESKRRRLQSLSAYSRENTISRDATNAFLNEAISMQRLPVKAHFHLLVWTSDPNQLADLRNKASAALAQMDAIPRLEVKGAPQVFWAGLPGNAAEIPINDTFDTFCEQAVCFFAQESNYRSVHPSQGIRFCDRLYNTPVYIDLFDQPRKLGWTSNMGTLICGSSGGGKSMTTNHILRSLYDAGAHCVTIDIGGSYRGLCELLDGYYFTFTEEKPICFNPFYLTEGDRLDTEKKESLKALLVALWKQESESFNRAEYITISNAIQGYYQHLETDKSIFPCFDSFYEYIRDRYLKSLKLDNVKDRDFDADNFMYVLRPYFKGGEFDYLLNARENLDILHKRFVVVEIDNIKDHPILFSVTTLAVCELFISKMRKLPGIRKVLAIDEAWKAITKSGMAEFLRYGFKTMRKFNGIPVVITQELDDLVSSPIVKDAIINNADVKILMDMKKFMNKFDKLQDTLGMSEKGKTQVLSVNKENREIYIDLGGQVMKVLKNELCPEEYYAFTTEGKERVKVLEYAEKHGSMEKGIKALVAETRLLNTN